MKLTIFLKIKQDENHKTLGQPKNKWDGSKRINEVSLYIHIQKSALGLREPKVVKAPSRPTLFYKTQKKNNKNYLSTPSLPLFVHKNVNFKFQNERIVGSKYLKL